MTSSPEKMTFWGISLSFRMPINVLTIWWQRDSRRLSIVVSSGSQQVLRMELLYPMTDNSFGMDRPFFVGIFDGAYGKVVVGSQNSPVLDGGVHR